jgi:hypothetical protein
MFTFASSFTQNHTHKFRTIMKYIATTSIISTIILCLSVGLFAQKATKLRPSVARKNSVSLQAAGQNGKGVSLDYQRIIWSNNKLALRGSVGVGQSILGNANKRTNFATIVPHSLTLNIGAGRSTAEFGLGGTYTAPYTPLGATNYSIYPMLGYRYQSASNVFLHLYFAPILFQNRNTDAQCLECPIPLDRSSAIAPWGGVGAGIAF